MATPTKKQLEKSQNGFVSTPNTKQEPTTTLKLTPSLAKEPVSAETTPKPTPSLAKEPVSAETTQTLSGQCAKSAISHVNTTQDKQRVDMDGIELKSVENGIG